MKEIPFEPRDRGGSQQHCGFATELEKAPHGRLPSIASHLRVQGPAMPNWHRIIPLHEDTPRLEQVIIFKLLNLVAY